MFRQTRISGGCLEILKSQSTTKLRYMGQTTILPGCYLRISAKVKAVSGPMCSARIAGWAGGAGGAHVGGLTETGPSTLLTTYGQVVEISAIVGTGFRTGVDMTWQGAIYGHFGLDLTGAKFWYRRASIIWATTSPLKTRSGSKAR